MNARIRPQTVTLVGKLLRPLSDAGAILVSEEREIIAQLRHLSRKGELMPPVKPKLLTQKEVAELLSVSHATFKTLEREGQLPFYRKVIGKGNVRYRNTEVLRFMMAEDDEG